MAIAKQRLFTVPDISGVLEMVRVRFLPAEVSELQDLPAPVVRAPVTAPVEQESARYQRLLEKELDRQHLTAVEQEDTEMLDRVRAALYAD